MTRNTERKLPIFRWWYGRTQNTRKYARNLSKKLYEKDTYIKFLEATPVGMLPSITGISDTPEYKENETVQKFSNAVDVITKTMDMGTAIGFEKGPSVQAGLLTSQGIIESMFQDIITNGTDVEKAAQTAEDKLNEVFSTVQ